VVIPCYRYGHYLPECVGSVLAQDGVDVDVLIVDDASPDDSAVVARRLAAGDPRVRVLEHRANQGHIATYNEGLAAVEGEYVVLLSADDLLTPGSLARATALLEAYPRVGVVYGFSPEFVDRVPGLRTTVRSWSIWDGPEWIAEVCRRGRNPVSTPDVVMRTAVMRELVGYDRRLPHAADFLLWLRAASVGQIGRINGADQALYRLHGANMHMERYAGVVTDITERHRMFEIFFAEDAVRLTDAEGCRLAARRALAGEAVATVCEAYGLGREEAESAERLIGLATAISPQVRRSAQWRAYERHLARRRSGSGLVRRVNRVTADVSYRVRWRRWRRYGLLDEVGSR
jgi:hypothetical protein